MTMVPPNKYFPTGWSQVLEKTFGAEHDELARDGLFFEFLCSLPNILSPNLLQVALGEYYEPGGILLETYAAGSSNFEFARIDGPPYFLPPLETGNIRQLSDMSFEALQSAIGDAVRSAEATTGRPHAVRRAVVDNALFAVDPSLESEVLEYDGGRIKIPVHYYQGRQYISVPPMEYVLQPPVSISFFQDERLVSISVSVHWSRWLLPRSFEFGLLRAFLEELRDAGWSTPWGVEELLKQT